MNDLAFGSKSYRKLLPQLELLIQIKLLGRGNVQTFLMNTLK